jgi:hypothetical protein
MAQKYGFFLPRGVDIAPWIRTRNGRLRHRLPWGIH